MVGEVDEMLLVGRRPRRRSTTTMLVPCILVGKRRRRPKRRSRSQWLSLGRRLRSIEGCRVHMIEAVSDTLRPAFSSLLVKRPYALPYIPEYRIHDPGRVGMLLRSLLRVRVSGPRTLSKMWRSCCLLVLPARVSRHLVLRISYFSLGIGLAASQPIAALCDSSSVSRFLLADLSESFVQVARCVLWVGAGHWDCG